jgi:hypothetical protein
MRHTEQPQLVSAVEQSPVPLPKPSTSLLDLPDDVMRAVAAGLRPRAVRALQLTNLRMRTLCTSPSFALQWLWRHAWRQSPDFCENYVAGYTAQAPAPTLEDAEQLCQWWSRAYSCHSPCITPHGTTAKSTGNKLHSAACRRSSSGQWPTRVRCSSSGSCRGGTSAVEGGAMTPQAILSTVAMPLLVWVVDGLMHASPHGLPLTRWLLAHEAAAVAFAVEASTKQAGGTSTAAALAASGVGSDGDASGSGVRDLHR